MMLFLNLQKSVLLGMVLWFLNWYFAFGWFNFILVKKGFTFRKHALVTSLFFSTVFIFTYVIYYNLFGLKYLILFILCWLILAVFGRQFKYIHAAPLKSILFDILYQQLMLVILLGLSKGLIIFVVVFSVSHLPVFFLRHLDLPGKITIFIGSVIGGLTMYLLLTGFSLGYIYSFLLHFGSYTALWFAIENRRRLGIIV
jgi:hypothetical protein